MAKINLRDLFPDDYDFNCYITVPDSTADTFIQGMTKEIADVYVDAYREDAAYIRRKYWNKAYYSIDSEEWLEQEGAKLSINPFDENDAALAKDMLLAAIDNLPEKQAKRIYAHYVLGMSKAEIAGAEGVDEKNIRQAIERGISKLKKFLKNISE